MLFFGRTRCGGDGYWNNNIIQERAPVESRGLALEIKPKLPRSPKR